ncbi:MAG: TonB-dependent receptor [Alphaproteobacteria bacterium]|nr:TonB-dependent receptor [Alphaproteobacteria bacterium]MBL6939534.1 TonB-dependent receptor [Alphaproteobacteria bacterium]MBL7100092.1 TonB-dependent receptor [Alphaproteobacteria bacterium]
MQIRFLAVTTVAALLFVSGRAVYAQDASAPPSGLLVYDEAYFADARPNTAMDMIRRLPGFAFDNGQSARGFAGTAANVLIDGQRPTSKTDDVQSILNRMPASSVARIEVIRGGAPGIDMQGLPVIANVIRKTAASTTIVLDFNDNIWMDGHTVPSLSVDYSRHSGGSIYELSLQRFGGYDDSVGLGHRIFTDSNGNIFQVDREDRQATGFGEGLNSAITMPLWGGTFKTNLTLQDSPFHSDLAFTHPGYRSDIISHTGNQNGELGVHWNGNIGAFETEFLGLQRAGRATNYNVFRDPSTDQRFLSVDLTSETIVRATARYHESAALVFEGGGEIAYNWLNGKSSFTLDGAPVAVPDANATVSEKRGEVFGQGTWKIDPELTLEVGARFEFSTISESGDTRKQRSFFYPKPRALLTWALDDKTQIRARFEKVLDQIDFGNFIATSDLGGSGVSAGNSDLKPQQRDQYELAFEWHFWDKGAITATLLHEEITDVSDLIVVTDSMGNSFAAPGNIGYGINNQLDIEATLPLDFLGIENGLLKSTTIWRSSRVHDPVTGQIRVITAQRPNDIEFAFTQDINSLKSTWGINWFNGWRERYYRLQELRDRKIPPGLLSVFWEYKPTPAWSLHFEFDNIDPFIYDDKHYDYSPSRAFPPPVTLEERTVRSQPRFYFEIRKTFN